MSMIGNRKHSKDAPLLRKLCHLLKKKKRKKPRRQVDSNSGPLDYEAVGLTTSPPPLPNKVKVDWKVEGFDSEADKFYIHS